jgi:hypothetical protein
MQEMKTAIYKLGEYKIIQSNTSELRWETHFGLAEQQDGRCFKKGMILFIGPAENNYSGFLKREFLDHLKPYPSWLKTKYYCKGLEVYHCKTGKRVTKKEMLLWTFDRGSDGGGGGFSKKSDQRLNNISGRREIVKVAFSLQRYEIIKKNGQVVWKTDTGPNTIGSGIAIILEDILFIGSKKNEQSNLTKRKFLSNLQQLPKWDETKYYSKLSLHDCRTGNRVQYERKRCSSENMAAETDHPGKGYKKSTRFKSRKSDLSNKHIITLTCWIRKHIIFAIALILLIISSLLVYMIHYWKEFKGRWH